MNDLVRLHRRHMRIRRSGIVLVACAAIALAAPLMAMPTSTAAAASAPTSHAPTHPVDYVPLRGAKGTTGFDRVFTNMDYNGGPVMPSNTDYMVLWSPTGLSAYPAGYVSGLATFFKDLAHDSGGHQNVDSVSAQYNDLTGAFARYQTTFGGALVDTDPYPPAECPAAAPVTACLTDAADPGRAREVRRLPRPEDRPQPRVLPAHASGCRELLHQ